MSSFLDSLYLPSSDEPQGVIPWAKSPEQTAQDLANGVARVGGHRAADYGQAYLLAANTLFLAARTNGTLDHHGLPIFFLQRHAAELLMKAPLQLAIDIQDAREEANQLRPPFPTARQRQRAQRSHRLAALLEDLDAMVVAMQVCAVPVALRNAVQQIIGVEEDPTWSRYSYRVEKVDGVCRFARHMDREFVLPLAQIQELLQTANVALGTIWPTFEGQLMGELGALWEQAARAVGMFD